MKAKNCLTEGEHSDVNEGNLRYLMDINFCRNVLDFIYLDGVSNFCKHLILREESTLPFLDHPKIVTDLVILRLVSFLPIAPDYPRFCFSETQCGPTKSLYFASFANFTKSYEIRKY